MVIDFIDMEDRRNNRLVERKLRDAMAGDRARIQLGRISAFGLLELSRQRLHPSLVETNFETCKHCSGVGVVRTVETTAVMVLRAIEEESLRGRSTELRVSVPTEVALYMFNHKREMISGIETRYNVRVFIHADDKLLKPSFNIDTVRAASGEKRQNRPAALAPVKSVDMSDMPDIDPEDITDDSTMSDDDRTEDQREQATREPREQRGERGEGRGDRSDRGDRDGRGRRRRGRRGGRDRDNRGEGHRDNRGERSDNRERPSQAGDHPTPASFDTEGSDDAEELTAGAEGEAEGNENPREARGEGADRDGRRRRRRGRRGGRGRDREGRGERGENREPRAEQAQAGGEANGNVAPEPRPEREPRREQAPRKAQESAPQILPVREPAAAHGGEDGGPKENRKGWWKRLTE